MSLNLRIYNRQSKTSKNGKTAMQYVCIFEPGRAGRTAVSDQTPPFYVRIRQEWNKLEARSLAEAKVEAQKAQDTQEAVEKGVSVLEVAGENKLSITIEKYLREVEANKSLGSYNAYRRSLELFREYCRRATVEAIDREDLLGFKTFLKRYEFSGRTIYNHFLNVTIFLVWAKHSAESIGIKENDWPAKPERLAEVYDEDEIEKLLKAADDDGRLLLRAFLFSGLRDGEMAHLTYGDIDEKTSLWRVQPKDGHNLKTEDSQRDVPVAESLTKKIMDRKKKLGKTDRDLVFPAPRGGVDEHLIRIVKRAAKAAGIEGRVDNHKFRSTAITIWLRNGSTVPDVMKWVGHVDTETILRYAAMVKLQDEKARKKITAPFEQYASMGD